MSVTRLRIRKQAAKPLRESKALDQLTAEIGDGMLDMASGAEQIDIAVNRVNDISVKNKKQLELLMSEVSRFKVD